MAETFLDPRFFDGTCYRAANWIEVGHTQGFGRVRGGAIGYQAHGAPKRVLVYPLQPGAAAQLAAKRAPAHWQPHRPMITLKPDQWRSLRAFLDQVSDTRSRRGLRYPLGTALTLLIAGRLAGCQTLTELRDFGRALSQETLARIGSRRRPQSGRCQAPGIGSWHYILKQVDSEQVEDLLGAWVAGQVPEMQAASAGGEPAVQAVALDGKVLRGSYDRDLGADGRPLEQRARQQVSALDLASGLVIGQRGFSGLKDEAEGVTLRALATQLKPSTCVIANALHTDRGTARHLLDHGLDFILTVKDNQPTVLDEVREGFHWQCMTPHASEGCEHGRIERRSIRVCDEFDPAVPCISFPGVRFVAQVQREVACKKDARKRKPETVYLLTSLAPELATAELLLQLNRTYRGIENRVHWVRDVALREDASRLRKGALPRLWAASANLVISILRLLRVPGIKRKMNQLHLRPDSAVQVLLG